MAAADLGLLAGIAGGAHFDALRQLPCTGLGYSRQTHCWCGVLIEQRWKLCLDLLSVLRFKATQGHPRVVQDFRINRQSNLSLFLSEGVISYLDQPIFGKD